MKWKELAINPMTRKLSLLCLRLFLDISTFWSICQTCILNIQDNSKTNQIFKMDGRICHVRQWWIDRISRWYKQRGPKSCISCHHWDGCHFLLVAFVCFTRDHDRPSIPMTWCNKQDDNISRCLVKIVENNANI